MIYINFMSDDRENDEVKLKPKTAFDLLFLAIIYIRQYIFYQIGF